MGSEVACLICRGNLEGAMAANALPPSVTRFALVGVSNSLSADLRLRSVIYGVKYCKYKLEQGCSGISD